MRRRRERLSSQRIRSKIHDCIVQMIDRPRASLLLSEALERRKNKGHEADQSLMLMPPLRDSEETNIQFVWNRTASSGRSLAYRLIRGASEWRRR